MQFVRNSYEFNQLPESTDHDEILKYLERIGRLCYRSDDLITEDSAIGFIERIKQRKHWAMLEHYIFTFTIPARIYDSIMDRNQFTVENIDYIQKLKFVNITKWMEAPDDELRYLISGSATAFNYLWACNNIARDPLHGIYQICEYLRSMIPEIMCHPTGKAPCNDPDKNKYMVDPEIRLLSRDLVKRLPPNIRLLHDWMSVHFTVERSSTHDLVRHRPASYAQESTRYCNYDKKGICFIIPCQFDKFDKEVLENEAKVNEMITSGTNIYRMDDDAYEWFLMVKKESEYYQKLLNKYKWSPQEAKSVIPHSIRAEINITAFLYEWRHIFNMRASKAAYPQIQEVMFPLFKECYYKYPDIYTGLEHKLEEGKVWTN